MADQTSITVCVIALTQQDYADLEPGIQAKLKGMASVYDFATAGKPYDSSPDDWQPFGDGLSIQKHLENAKLRPSLVSAQLYNPKLRPAALKSASLYIIDPLVLAHPKMREWLTRDVQLAIYVTGKAFCVILPGNLPEPLRAEIRQLAETELDSLSAIWTDEDRYEWGVDETKRLQKYLKSLPRQLAPQPVAGQLAIASSFLPAVNLPGLPQMVS